MTLFNHEVRDSNLFPPRVLNQAATIDCGNAAHESSFYIHTHLHTRFLDEKDSKSSFFNFNFSNGHARILFSFSLASFFNLVI